MSRCDSCRYQNDFEFHACHICHMEKDMYKPKKTNADRIRAMSDEELAEWIWGVACPGFPATCFGSCPEGQEKSCSECWLEWLKKEVEP